MSRFSPVLLAFLLVVPLASAQSAPPQMTNPVPFTPAEVRLAGMDARQQLHDRSLVANLPLENIGPTVMSGRVVDVDVSPFEPTHFYVAYASGGLWETQTNGITFEPLFDDQAVMTLGDIAVDWRRGGTIWAGTGENNSSRSSYAGAGIYMSADRGETWQHRGLAETHHIGRIVLHPDDPNIVWVAAIGHLYSPNPERGVYKTTDGGETWTQVLFVDDNTGAIDLVIDPNDPSTLYAAMWHRERRAWNFVESGPGSGIYKTTDGGDNWARLTLEGSGFPTGAGVGRIGLDIFPGDPNTLYAILDNQDRRPEEDEADEDAPTVTRDALRAMTTDAFLALDPEDIDAYLRDENFPTRYTAQVVVDLVRDGTIRPAALVEFVEDANAQLFDTPVIGLEIYRSDDAGQTWRKTHEDYLDRVYNSYGYYFGEVRVDARDANRIYAMGVPILRSDDGGATFQSINGANVHVDHHALWVNPNRTGHLINGNDGGINISYDDGETWFKANTPSVGQFYAVQVDDAQPYRVYGGLQDNGVWYGPHTYNASRRWHGSGDYPYDGLMGGDGMQIEVDTRTNDIVYTGFQFGFYFRINTATGERSGIRPRHELGERPLRFNWQTPIHLSRHNQDIFYIGANRLYRSFNQGDDLHAISEDLTRGGQPGDVPFGTLATLDESPLQFGLIYTGSDDGLVHVTPDGGVTWRRIDAGLPQNLWVSRVEASHHENDRVYVTLNGYRWDNFEAHVYRSDDQGATWTRLGLDLPPEPVNVIVEDPANADLLYVGTDHGLYVSLDRGASFMAMQHGMPHAPVHDLKVQARAKDLIVGTHGRSIYRADIEHLQRLDDAMLARTLHVFEAEETTYRDFWGTRSATWADYRTPEVTLGYFAGQGGTATLRVKDAEGTLLHEWTDDAERGLNYVTYDLTATADRVRRYNRGKANEEKWEPADDDNHYLPVGTYTVEVSLSGVTEATPLEVKAPRRRASAEPAPELSPNGWLRPPRALRIK